MNSSVGGNNLRSSQEASALVDRVKFEGMTPLGTNLDARIIKPLFTDAIKRQALNKPILVICITDGEPTGEPVEKVVQVGTSNQPCCCINRNVCSRCLADSRGCGLTC